MRSRSRHSRAWHRRTPSGAAVPEMPAAPPRATSAATGVVREPATGSPRAIHASNEMPSPTLPLRSPTSVHGWPRPAPAPGSVTRRSTDTPPRQSTAIARSPPRRRTRARPRSDASLCICGRAVQCPYRSTGRCRLRDKSARRRGRSAGVLRPAARRIWPLCGAACAGLRMSWGHPCG